MGEHLRDRFEWDAPKRILALDGGGTRGIVTLKFLAEIERVLEERFKANYANKTDFRLAHYFDLIGGTSVGSMLATMLAMGKRVEEIDRRFNETAPHIFRRRRTWLGTKVMGMLGPRHSAATLRGVVTDIVGDAELASEKLTTGLCVIAKRVDTNSTWVLINNPNAKYYGEPGDKRVDDRGNLKNRNYKLADMILASTAAPTIFSPLSMKVHDAGFVIKNKEGQATTALFMDGGLSPHNSPALAMFMAAGMSGYRLGGVHHRALPGGESEIGGKAWRLGHENLLIVSVGTGRHGKGVGRSWLKRTFPAAGAVDALLGMTADGQELGLALLQWLSPASDLAWEVDSEIGDLRHDVLGHPEQVTRPLLSFQRYDLRLDHAWLKRATDRNFSDDHLERLRDFTDPREIATLGMIADTVAPNQVKPEHFPAQFDMLWHTQPARPVASTAMMTGPMT